MSDFFANLAARARVPGDAVRPRLPARFETPEPGSPAVADAPFDVAIEREPARAPAPRAPASARATGDGAPSAAPQQFVAPPAVEAPIARTTSAAPAVAEPPFAVAPRAFAPAGGQAPAAPPPALAAPRAAVHDERREEPRPEPPVERAIEPRVRSDAAVRPAPPNDAPRRDAVRDVSASAAPRVQGRSTERIAVEIVPVVARVSAASAAPAPPPRAARAARERPPFPPAPPAETTVNVTIGRIEVRAASAPVERRREPALPAVMSLGEYLSTRAEAARR
ncbi:MAG TPA: hypothetical protein VN224_06665 [Xanthomonadales bacterium]|nr:hypothetical protein [Xanthomonadales bacterium]